MGEGVTRAVRQAVVLRGVATEDGDGAHSGIFFGVEGAAFGFGGVEAALDFVFFVGGGVAGLVARFDVARELFEGGDGGVGGAGTGFGGAGAVVLVGDFGADEQLCGVGLFGGREGSVAGGIGVALFLPEEVGFPAGAEAETEDVGVFLQAVVADAARKRVLCEEGAGVGADGVLQVGVEAVRVCAEAGGRAEVGVGETGDGARFLQAAAGDGDVGVVGEGAGDEAVKDGVLPLPPPAADVVGLGGCRGAVVGGGQGDAACGGDGGGLAGAEEGGGEGEEEGAGGHGHVPWVDGFSSVVRAFCGSAAGRSRGRARRRRPWRGVAARGCRGLRRER